MQLNTRSVLGWIIGALLASAPLCVALADPAPAKADAQATKTKTSQAAAPSSTQASRKLDLSAPKLNRVFSPNELETLTNRPEEIGEDADTVAVKGARHDRPNVPPGIAGIAWGIRHPTRAWRLFVPAPSD